MDNRTIFFGCVSTGNICTVMAFEERGHGFFNLDRDDKRPFVDTVRAMDRFLSTLGYLTGRPTLAAPDGS